MKINPKSNSKSTYYQSLSRNINNIDIVNSLSDNLKIIRDLFSNCPDVVYREFVIDSLDLSAVLIFINEITDKKLINDSVITSLMNIKDIPINDIEQGHVVEIAKKYFLQIANISEVTTIAEIESSILDGNAIFLVDGDIKALKMATTEFKERNVAESTSEKVIRGPKESFTENINTNIALLRHKIKSSSLKLENYTLGRQTKTKVYLAYMQGIAQDRILNEVRKRIERINVDSILESGYIEEFIEDAPYSIFPKIFHSERPDRIAGAILEGRIAIIVDGTPIVLIVPTTMLLFLQTSEEYYVNYIFASSIRILRIIFFFISLLLPAVYVAVISYHKEIVPTTLLISIMQSSRGVPFPVFVEALLMEIAFEALREAGIRLPVPANQTVGIVGALVIGEAAVKAGIISSIMVIIISITAVASFGVPSYDMGYTIRILRFIMLLLGASFGLYGILLGLLVILIHLVSLRSFGINYLSPIAPLNLNELKDAFVRFPWWAMDKRPAALSVNNRTRQRSHLKPNHKNK